MAARHFRIARSGDERRLRYFLDQAEVSAEVYRHAFVDDMGMLPELDKEHNVVPVSNGKVSTPVVEQAVPEAQQETAAAETQEQAQPVSDAVEQASNADQKLTPDA